MTEGAAPGAGTVSARLAPPRAGDATTVAWWSRSAEEARRWCSVAEHPFPAERVRGWWAGNDVQPWLLAEGPEAVPVGYGELWVDGEEDEVELARLIVRPGTATGRARAAARRLPGRRGRGEWARRLRAAGGPRQRRGTGALPGRRVRRGGGRPGRRVEPGPARRVRLVRVAGVRRGLAGVTGPGRGEVVDRVADHLLAEDPGDRPLRVGVDGITAAGKTGSSQSGV